MLSHPSLCISRAPAPPAPEPHSPTICKSLVARAGLITPPVLHLHSVVIAATVLDLRSPDCLYIPLSFESPRTYLEALTFPPTDNFEKLELRERASPSASRPLQKPR